MTGIDEKLKALLLSYSVEDLLKSFLVLNLWLPNIACPIKIQYLYTVLESIHKDLPSENKIYSYEEFESFWRRIFELLPTFMMLEDYVPEADWGEVKYYYNEKAYRIFYGGDLSNPYDYYYSFEIIHHSFVDFYQRKCNRFILNEFEFCLSLQDYIINHITQTKPLSLDINPGDISIPSNEFWIKVNRFVDQFDPESLFEQSLIKIFTCEFDSINVSAWLGMEKIVEFAFAGRNCLYYFIKKNGKYFPVMPRKYFSILYDNWGNILKENYDEIGIERKTPHIDIGIELFKFIRDRFDEDNVFGLVSPVDEDKRPHKAIFPIAIRSKDKLFLIHTTPPPIDSASVNDYLEKLNGEIKESQKLISAFPTRLLLLGRKEIIEFRSKKKEGETLSPIFLTVVPCHLSSETIKIAIPEGFPGEIIGLDQIVGIIDELQNEEELSDFIEFVEELQSISVPPLTSYLDKFGAFRDSKSVLIAGAKIPDMMVLDFHWGTSIRFRSLSEFWRQFPEVGLFSHPRSWLIPEKSDHPGSVVLKSKKFKGYAYCQRVGNATLFINSPIHLMNLNQAKISDLIMQMIFDSLDLYESELKYLDWAKGFNRIQVIIFPDSLVKENAKLNHLVHLLPGDELWLMDITTIGRTDYGIRFVYNEEKIISTFQDTSDRSLQINLLIRLLQEINDIWNDEGMPKIGQKMMQEKVKKSRFKLLRIEKTVSFPEMIRTIVPEEKDYKIADKVIAKLASALNITPGEYMLDDAKVSLNQLIYKLVDQINFEVSKYELESSIILLLEKIDALIREHDIKRYQIEKSFDQEIEYDREERTSKDYAKFMRQYRNYRYLIEKLIQVQPSGAEELVTSNLKQLLAVVDRLLNLYYVSDSIQYDIYPTEVTIDSDFLVHVTYKEDVPAKEEAYGREKAQIDLGIIGQKEDVPGRRIPIISYMEELDKAFKKDIGFEFRDLIKVQQIMRLWPEYFKDASEHSYYSATLAEISQACCAGIRDFVPSETGKIVDFLTLKQEEMLKIVGDTRLAPDLPIWEYKKRLSRYVIKPIIKINEKYYWGPHSIDRAGRIWSNVPHVHRLPVDISAPTVWIVLSKGHMDVEKSLEDKIKEIVKRYSDKVETNIYPHKLTPGIKDIGDCDVLVLLEENNILLDIESKIIDPAYCLKDIKRVREKIFGRNKTDGSLEKGYLHRVQEREYYLKNHSMKVLQILNWPAPEIQPKVISVFVTQIGFWWTKFPPVETDVKFVEIRLLDDFINDLSQEA